MTEAVWAELEELPPDRTTEDSDSVTKCVISKEERAYNDRRAFLVEGLEDFVKCFQDSLRAGDNLKKRIDQRMLTQLIAGSSTPGGSWRGAKSFISY